MNVAEYRQLLTHGGSKRTTSHSDCLTEHTECIDLVYKLNELKDEGKIIEFTHISNETYTKSWNQKRKNKAEGVKKGVPDYLIILRDKIVFIEMKRVKASATSPEQKAWISAINNAGGYAKVCKGSEAAINYLTGLL